MQYLDFCRDSTPGSVDLSSQPQTCHLICSNNISYTKMHVDYSVYLVTDNTPAILGEQDLIEVVRAAVEGGQKTIAVNQQLLNLTF
jgi:hypothetical protein